MKAVLEILPVDLDSRKCILLLEISNNGFSYAIKNDEDNIYIAVAIFHYANSNGDVTHADLLEGLQHQPVLSGNFKKIYILYSFDQSVLIPFSLYSSQENVNVLNLIHGDLEGNNNKVFADMVAAKGIYNTYRVPEAIAGVLKSRFPDALNIHQYSVLLKQAPAGDNHLRVIFYPKKLIVLLIKEGSTQFINTFWFDAAEDVSYILMNICKQFEVENIPVEIGGLIEMNSALYKEIYKYFTNVTLAGLPGGCNYSEEISRHPAHYFSHIFAVDSCE